jgi:hypothetical protein
MHLFNAEAGVIPHFKKEKILSSIGFVLKYLALDGLFSFLSFSMPGIMSFPS